MEKILLENILKHMKGKKVIRSSQHAFYKGKSCLVNLIAFYNEVPSLVDVGVPGDVVFMDISNAFESLSCNKDGKTQKQVSGQ